MSLILEIASRVRATPSGCVEWQGALNKGYGVIGRGRRVRLVHRVVYEIEHGIALSPSQHLCHMCDNPKCVNTKHLFLGDAKANVADMIAKGREVRACGEAAGSARLSEAEVSEIRVRYRAGGMSHRQLGEEYGVSHTAIGWALRGQSWTRGSGLVRGR